MTHKRLLAGCGLVCLALSACGGGGGGGVASIPPPPVTPPGTPPPPVTGASVSIFSNPMVGEFASVGVSAQTTGTGSGSAHSFGPLSNADADQVHIRYTSGGFYEIEIPGKDWERLTIAKGTTPQDPTTFNLFQPESAPQNGAFLGTSVSKLQGYKYSELGTWSDGAGKHGEIAFGEATLASQIPQTGSATFAGIVRGTSDVIASDSFDGTFNAPVEGTVDLNFDFAKGTLAGSMTVALNAYGPTTPIGTFAFTDTVYSAGSPTYSGKFDTASAGDNFFLGRFTGPHAEETIGAWALPFHLSGDVAAHQAFGAWIAKQP
jgi:hypothetical protein